MLEQRVQGPSLKGLRGVGLIALVAVALFIASAAFSALEGVVGTAASLLFLLFGGAVAWLLLNRYVLGYIYTCANGCLRVCRTYGKREWLMVDVWLNGVKACGAPEAMKRRFPGARRHRATKSACPIEPLAVAFNDAGRTAILVLQPEPALREMIVEAVKK